MDNKEFLEKLKFGIGDGNLQYYIYNWICPTMKPQEVSQIIIWFCKAFSMIYAFDKEIINLTQQIFLFFKQTTTTT